MTTAGRPEVVDVAALAEALAAHSYVGITYDDWRCKCGEHIGSRVGMSVEVAAHAHWVHQAAALVPLITAREHEAAAAAVRLATEATTFDEVLESHEGYSLVYDHWTCTCKQVLGDRVQTSTQDVRRRYRAHLAGELMRAAALRAGGDR